MIAERRKKFALTWLIFAGPVTNYCSYIASYVCIRTLMQAYLCLYVNLQATDVPLQQAVELYKEELYTYFVEYYYVYL